MEYKELVVLLLYSLGGQWAVVTNHFPQFQTFLHHF